MRGKISLLLILSLVSLIMIGCGGKTIDDTEKVQEIPPKVSAVGGLPTPFEPRVLGDYGKDSYKRKTEKVDYDAISPEEFRIREAIEFVIIHNSQVTGNQEDILEVDVERYGIKNFCRYGDLILFRTYGDMKTVLNNSDFQKDLYNKHGLRYEPMVYYLPAHVAEDYSERTFLASDEKYYSFIYGYEQTDDGNYYTVVWGVFSILNNPGADEIAQFYANLDGLKVESDEGEAGTIYHLTAKDGCAFFEKFAVRTNEPATAYIWEQDEAIGVIILPGEHEAENINLCVLEKHKL